MEQGLKRIIKEMSLFQTGKEYIKPLLDFLINHQNKFFIYKKYRELNQKVKIPYTTNAAECGFSIYKPGYRVSKHYESEQGAQDSFDLTMLWHNLRKFREGKRRGKSPLELEGYKSLTSDWVELIWGKYKDIPLSEVIEPIKQVANVPEKLFTNYIIYHKQN